MPRRQLKKLVSSSILLPSKMQADKKKISRQLAIAKGQMDGIQKRIENNSYCIDISNQLLSTISILKHVNQEIISAHLSHCVRHAETEKEKEEKLKEIDSILERRSDL